MRRRTVNRIINRAIAMAIASVVDFTSIPVTALSDSMVDYALEVEGDALKAEGIAENSAEEAKKEGTYQGRGHFFFAFFRDKVRTYFPAIIYALYSLTRPIRSDTSVFW